MERLVPHPRRTHCEWKGEAEYFTVEGETRSAEAGAWEYATPRKGFEALRGHLAFYSGGMDDCYVDEERVDPQAGRFYGGWITSDIKGPFKGGPGTMGW
jgi:uncharacterized protein (DUF427 family)